MSHSKFKLLDLNDERAKLGMKQSRDLFDAKTQMTGKIDNVQQSFASGIKKNNRVGVF